MRRQRLVVVTGLSGSGKSTVAKCFEDLGYYCVDNLPLPLLRDFLRHPFQLVGEERQIAVVTDVRAPGFATEFPQVFSEIDRWELQPVLLFLESSDEALMRRFSETRRPHPMANDLPLDEAIAQERELLAELRGIADMVFDTSEWSIHETRSNVYRAFAVEAQGPGMQVSLVSFGFKYGIPMASDLLFDVRFLPNPHYDLRLRPMTGRDADVRDYVLGSSGTVEYLDRLYALLDFLFPRYAAEGKAHLTIGIGCTGGHHRSVAIAEAVAERYQKQGYYTIARHRDVACD
jgi:RNase adapter protein RapZ